MSPRGPHGGESEAGEKRLASSSDVLFQADLDCGGLTADWRTRWHGVGHAPKVLWKNKYLLSGTAVLIIYGIMRLRPHVSFALLLATSATRPVVGQCPSYTEYAKVDALNSFLRQYRRDVLRIRTERRRRAHWVSHICGQIPPAEPSRVPQWR